MKKIILILLVTTNLSFADTFFGVNAGIQTWLYNTSGNLSVDNNVFNAINNLDENSENSTTLFASLEHGIPLLPNFKIKHTNFETDYYTAENNNCLTIFPIECFPDTGIDLSHTDITLYYEILDNWVNLDLGFSAIYFNGSIDFDRGFNSDVDYSELVPALYGKAMIELPITDLSVSLTTNVATLTDNTIIDFEIATQYKIGLGFSVEAGLRQQTIDLEDDNGVDIHSNATGVFAALNFHF